MALRVISGLKDVGATETRCPECSWDVLGMFAKCLPNVCDSLGVFLANCP